MGLLACQALCVFKLEKVWANQDESVVLPLCQMLGILRSSAKIRDVAFWGSCLLSYSGGGEGRDAVVSGALASLGILCMMLGR